MATTTALLTAQAVGTGANKGTGLYAAQLALQAATSALFITGQLTNGAGAPPDRKQRIRVWFATSPFDDTTGIAAQFENDARELDLYQSGLPSGKKVTTSDLVLNAGGGAGFLYYWLEVPAFAVVASLNLDCVEI